MAYNREWYLKQKALGLCSSHAARPVRPGASSCDLCLDRRRLRHKEIKDSAMCARCEANVSEPGKVLCEGCRQTHVDKYYTDKTFRCPNHADEIPIPGQVYCAKCREYRREWRLKRDYDLTSAQFQEKLDSQSGKCSIRDVDVSTDNRACIDHNHVTNGVRGILCGTCNSVLGFVKESTETLRRAALYLEYWNKED